SCPSSRAIRSSAWSTSSTGLTSRRRTAAAASRAVRSCNPLMAETLAAGDCGVAGPSHTFDPVKEWSSPMDDTVGAVRGFNRYYTRVIGALGEGHLDSPYTLTEARILYEMAQHESVDVAELRRGLVFESVSITRTLTRYSAVHLF